MIRNLREVTGHKVDSQIDSIYNSGDRDELFYEIAQCLVWSYTSNVGNGNNPLQISQIIYKSNVKSDVYAVYSALKEQADKQTNYTSPNLNANKIKNYINSLSFDDSQATISGNTAGPFILNNYDSTISTMGTWSVKIDGTEQKQNDDYTINRDGNKFYVNFTKNLASECNISVDLTQTAIQTSGKYWVQVNAGQQLISISKRVHTKTISASVSRATKTEYYLSVVKQDFKDGDELTAKVTVKSGDEILFDGQETPTGEIGPFTDDTKTFTITEDKAPVDYVNTFKGLKIELNVEKNGEDFNIANQIYGIEKNNTLFNNLKKVITEIKSNDFSLPQTTKNDYLSKAHEETLNVNGNIYKVKVVKMADLSNSKATFDLKRVQPVTLSLLNGQVDIILRALELYGYKVSKISLKKYVIIPAIIATPSVIKNMNFTERLKCVIDFFSIFIKNHSLLFILSSFYTNIKK